MYLIQDDFAYLLADREYYEPLDRLNTGDTTYSRVVERVLPSTWERARKGLWMNCRPPEAVTPPQGWKVHISATLGNACPILATVARFCIGDTLTFKYVAEPAMLMLQNSKRWNRGGSGKFMTLYPQNEQHCREIMETLRTLLTGYRGPYILSDRRYRDSEVVYYRYGGLLPISRLDVEGRRIPVIAAENEQYTDDRRNAFFYLPPNVTDPFADGEDPLPETLTLKNGRYRIDEAITFSASGGVYRGTDLQTGGRVLIKEARPLTNVSPRGVDAVWLLKKEERLLELVAHLGIAPRPLDFFRDWEHSYLVEEYLDGINLRGFSAQWMIMLRIAPTREETEEFFKRYCRVLAHVAEVVEVLHEHNIVFSDLSHYNVMVQNDGHAVRFIDFEGAYEQDVDVPTLMFTPGFAPTDLIERGESVAEDDCFALGGLMLAALMPVNSLMGLDPQAADRFVTAISNDFGIPPQVGDTIRGLIAQDRTARIQPRAAAEALRDARLTGDPFIRPAAETDAEITAFRDEVVNYIVSSATPDREDRLFPSDPQVFETNPLSVGWGACGVVHALHRITGQVPRPLLDWIFSREVVPELYAPGMYTGLCGMAWTMLEIGFPERANEWLQMARGHYLLRRAPDLMNGAAGWGMTELKFWLETGLQTHVQAAEDAARAVIDSAEDEDGAWKWKSFYGYCPGLGHGSAGMGLFLSYLYAATGNEKYLHAAERALRYVLRTAKETPDGTSWKVFEGHPTHTPYWRWGSAGVGIALLRYLAVAPDPDPELRDLLDRLFSDTNRKYSIFPGRFFGLSGVGEFHLDGAAMSADRERHLNAARRNLAGVLLFQVRRPAGVAFPGDTLSRISCDLGTGSAGVALFLHRLVTGTGASFMLDELLPARTARPATLTLDEAAALV